jgi:exosortase H (IPTLxxWG-CTERM-specific)
MARFILVTLASLAAFFTLGRLDVFERHVTDPYLSFIAGCSRWALRLVGVEAEGAGTLVVSPGFSANIVDLCSGLGVTAIFFSAVLGFPSTWRSRFSGLAAGFPGIFLINLTRIVVLFIIGANYPGVFEDVHQYYAQAFVMFATVGTWLVWVWLFSAYGAKHRHAVPR